MLNSKILFVLFRVFITNLICVWKAETFTLNMVSLALIVAKIYVFIQTNKRSNLQTNPNRHGY